MNAKQFELLCTYSLQGIDDDILNLSADDDSSEDPFNTEEAGNFIVILDLLISLANQISEVPKGICDLLCEAKDGVQKTIDDIKSLVSYIGIAESNKLISKDVSEGIRFAIGNTVNEMFDGMHNIIYNTQERIENYQTKLGEQEAATEKLNAMAAAHQALHDMAAAKTSGSQGEEIV
jgi:hypothetical protein